jgi:hypothetical protein
MAISKNRIATSLIKREVDDDSGLPSILKSVKEGDFVLSGTSLKLKKDKSSFLSIQTTPPSQVDFTWVIQERDDADPCFISSDTGTDYFIGSLIENSAFNADFNLDFNSGIAFSTIEVVLNYTIPSGIRLDNAYAFDGVDQNPAAGASVVTPSGNISGTGQITVQVEDTSGDGINRIYFYGVFGPTAIDVEIVSAHLV